MLLFTILILNILVGAEIDIILPSFPDIKALFNLTTFEVELLLSVNLIAYCLASFIVGNLADYYGNKPILLMGLLIFIAGNIICLLPYNYHIILLGRFLQGIGISAAAVLSFLIISDNYPLDKQKQFIGIVNGVVTMAMAMAPVAGSYVHLLFNWKGNFVLLLILAIICFLLSLFFIPKEVEKLKYDQKLSIFPFKGYLSVIKSKKSLYFILAICFLVQPYWIFIGLAPILYMVDLGVSLHHFGYYQGALAVVFSLVSINQNFFSKIFGSNNFFKISITMIAVFIVLCMTLVITGSNNPLLITLVMSLLAASVAFPINTLWPLSLETMPESKGKISALMIAGRLFLTSLGLQVVGYFYSNSFALIGIVMCIALALFFIILNRLSSSYPLKL